MRFINLGAAATVTPNSLKLRNSDPWSRTEECSGCTCEPAAVLSSEGMHSRPLGKVACKWLVVFCLATSLSSLMQIAAWSSAKSRATCRFWRRGRCSWSAWSWTARAQPHSCWWNGLCGSPTSQSGRLWPAWVAMPPSTMESRQPRTTWRAGCTWRALPRVCTGSSSRTWLCRTAAPTAAVWRSGCPAPVACGTNRLRTPLARWLFASLDQVRVNLPRPPLPLVVPLCDSLCVA